MQCVLQTVISASQVLQAVKLSRCTVLATVQWLDSHRCVLFPARSNLTQPQSPPHCHGRSMQQMQPIHLTVIPIAAVTCISGSRGTFSHSRFPLWCQQWLCNGFPRGQIQPNRAVPTTLPWSIGGGNRIESNQIGGFERSEPSFASMMWMGTLATR